MTSVLCRTWDPRGKARQGDWEERYHRIHRKQLTSPDNVLGPPSPNAAPLLDVWCLEEVRNGEGNLL